MWKNGKEGNTEGDTEGDESWKEKTGDGRWETIETEEKNGAEEGGMRQGAPRGHLAEV